MTDSTLLSWLTINASTKRNPAKSGGKIGDPVTNLALIKIVPPMPVDQEIRERYDIQSPRQVWVTYAQEQDVLEGDILLLSGNSTEFQVSGVGPWPGDDEFLEIIYEEVDGT